MDEVNEHIKNLLDSEEKQIDIERTLATTRTTTSTTISIGVKEYLDKRSIPISRIIEVGFRSLLTMREKNQRINELEGRINQMEKSIERYDKRIREMCQKVEELKKEGKIPEDVEL